MAPDPLVKQGCLANEASFPNPSPANAACHTWCQWALREIKTLHADVVLMAQRLNGDTSSHTIIGLQSELRQLTYIDEHVLLLRDDPANPIDPVNCLLRSGATFGRCTFPEPPGGDYISNAVSDVATSLRVTLIPTSQWFCSQYECPLVIGNVIIYVAGGHITPVFASLLGPTLSRELNFVTATL